MLVEHELGMPLDGENGSVAGHGYRLDQSIGGMGDSHQARRQVTDRLVMKRIDTGSSRGKYRQEIGSADGHFVTDI
jgi:hypothetical protein